MPNYKGLLIQSKLQQKDLLESIQKVEPRVDKYLLSKMVNYICLPTPAQVKVICEKLNCNISELYRPTELFTIQRMTKKQVSTPDGMTNIHVRVESSLVKKVFSQDAMIKLNIKNKNDCIRNYLLSLEKELDRMNALEKELDRIIEQDKKEDAPNVGIKDISSKVQTK